MAFSNINLKKILSSTEFQKQIDIIRGIGEHRLREAIWDNIYMTYTPKEYKRTYELLNAVSSYYKIIGDTIEIKVYLDPDKMNHFSIVDNQPTYVPPLLNYGFSWSGWEDSTPDYFHNRPESLFLEKAMEEIQNDMQKAVLNAVVIAFNSNRYR
jgi:hypothetical protein